MSGGKGRGAPSSQPDSVEVPRLGLLIPPKTDFARRVIRRDSPEGSPSSERIAPAPQRASNLTVLLSREEEKIVPHRHSLEHIHSSTEKSRIPEPPARLDEADSASGPRLTRGGHCSSSAPIEHRLSKDGGLPGGRRYSEFYVAPPRKSSIQQRQQEPSPAQQNLGVRRCLSSKEMGTLAPPSGSPYQYLLDKKTELETSTRERLQSLRGSNTVPLHTESTDENSSTNSASRRHEGANQLRHRRRAEHNQAVIMDLCEVVADLFVAESKLLKPRNYGVTEDPSCQSERDNVVKHVQAFLAALPTRYALSADTPSEVLLHMRLMSAARSDHQKAAVHIHNLENDDNWKNQVREGKILQLVTIACSDAVGLLELITKNLGTGGARVLDADVMLSKDGIVLDRFVVEMNGRLRLDKLATLIENFLRQTSCEAEVASSSTTLSSPSGVTPGSLYHHSTAPQKTAKHAKEDVQLESGVPLLQILASPSSSQLISPSFPILRRGFSMPAAPAAQWPMPNPSPDGVSIPSVSTTMPGSPPSHTSHSKTNKDRRALVNRRAVADLDVYCSDGNPTVPLDFVTVQNGVDEARDIPLIPFDEIMLIETIGTGRASTIYRAVWQDSHALESPPETNGHTQVANPVTTMVALKVAMVDPSTGDCGHVDEVRREADIAARLNHPSICDLVGVAADSACFCLAYEFCEGGSLLSLLADTSRLYEYLPIALDIANGMAYLHSRNVIHRDLKPSNILLTRDHRAKIADFGMSVTNTGQELTAETGTYRYMAPEVIRHESYSSNADVYSFGICLWQLITREVPFANMTPIQAAYAVAEGNRPEIPQSTPRRLQEIITACWDQDSRCRPSFTYVAMALADYAKMAFSPANVGALTLQIANDMLSKVEGNSTVNVDFTTPLESSLAPASYLGTSTPSYESANQDTVGLEI